MSLPFVAHANRLMPRYLNQRKVRSCRRACCHHTLSEGGILTPEGDIVERHVGVNIR